jgi:hypothetical protein
MGAFGAGYRVVGLLLLESLKGNMLGNTKTFVFSPLVGGEQANT